jgi:hypothetical protein
MDSEGDRVPDSTIDELRQVALANLNGAAG